jgi:hypothetical protein
MKQRRLVITLSAVVAAGALWYAFRPERLFIDQTVSEGLAAAAATSGSGMQQVLATGRFHGVAHESKGTATVHQLADGKRVLRFTDFETSNGPDLRVYLVAADDARDSDAVKNAGFVDIGPLKGNRGDQNYDLPADLDLAKYRAATVWCRRFGVNFGTAPLSAGAMSAAEPAPLASGRFHGVAHAASGAATVYQLANGRRLLRFTDFETSNGPDLRVYLVAAADAGDSDTVKDAGFVDIGPLKGNRGDQNYDLPADLDLAKYRAATVWCRRFGVNFATAPLSAQ